MGSCEETARLLSDYVDGELRGLVHMRLRIHLAICGRCRAVGAGFRGTIEALRRLGDDVPAPRLELADAVVARIRGESR